MTTTPTGRSALDALTALARRQRLAGRFDGAAEAADLQWRSKSDPGEHPGTTTIWHDDDGPVAAVWTREFRLGVDLAVLCLDDALIAECRSHAAGLLADLTVVDVHTEFQSDDPDWTAWAVGLGFEQTDDVIVTAWRDAHPPRRAPLPDGYRITSRDQMTDRPHHLVARNGDHIAERLSNCSIYRSDLDLAVVTAGGEVAAYGLFWADPVTGVGLVEPMRTEDAHQGRGLARAVLAEGMQRLIDAGCDRLKISWFADNGPAEHVYLDAGFVPHERNHFLFRPASAPQPSATA